MLTVLLTRHGHTDKSEPEQYLGQRLAATLTERGRADAHKLADRLRGVPVDRLISSPLARAVATAEILAPAVGATVETDARLLELDYGGWEGLTIDLIDAKFPGQRELYEIDPAMHNVGGGESGIEVAARVSDLIDSLLGWGLADDERDRTALLVGHSSVNRVLLALVLGVALRDYRRRFRQDWTSLTVLRWPDRESGPLLLLANDVAHTQGVRAATWE